MGRGLMIFIVGMFIVMGIFNFASQNRLVSSEEDMVSQVHYTMASTTAMSALEMAGQALLLETNEDFRKDGDVWNSFLEDGSVSVALSRNGNDIRLVSTGTTEGVSATIVADYLLQTGGGIPALDSALGFYSSSLDFSVQGNSFRISGCDHTPPDITSGDCDDKYGIATNKPANTNIILDALKGNQDNNVTGSGGSPSVGTVDNDGSFIDEAIAEFAPRADWTIKKGDDGKVNQDNDKLGTPGNPRIIVVEDGGVLDVNMNQNSTAGGIIIVKEGAELKLAGTFNYHGLILVQGRADFTSGQLTLYGGMLFGGEEPELEIYDPQLDINGRIRMYYSSSVLEALDQSLGGGPSSRRLVLLQQFQ